MAPMTPCSGDAMPRHPALTADQVAAAEAEHQATRQPWKAIAAAYGCSRAAMARHRKRLQEAARSKRDLIEVEGAESPAVDTHDAP